MSPQSLKKGARIAPSRFVSSNASHQVLTIYRVDAETCTPGDLSCVVSVATSQAFEQEYLHVIRGFHSCGKVDKPIAQFLVPFWYKALLREKA
jgi:hypothetical protein